MPAVSHATVPPLIAALMEPRRYPHPVEAVERLETHISWVLLAGEFAYKIKKPVALGFLDFSTLDARLHYCQEELRLNRATAPKLYLEVVTITGTETAPALGGGGVPLEYALKMRRFSQDALLDRLARRGELEATLIDRLAATVAAFHASAAVADAGSSHGSPANITRPARENFDQIAKLAPSTAASLTSVRAWTESASVRLEAAFATRKAGGCVRECHGDLHLGNIAMIDGEPTPFDCIEFNPEFRWIDVMSEIAFLVMDLLERDLAARAWRCLNRYLEISGDYDGVVVLRYYLVYRAMVRAKVALLHSRQNVGGAVRHDEEEAFAHHLRLAEKIASPGRPALVLMHGLSGSGKTTVAQMLLETLGALRVRSDVERKRLQGLAAKAHSGSAVGGGLYDAQSTERTYERLAAVAEAGLRAGWRVIVDAASLQRQRRDMFRAIARAMAVPFVIVSCQAADDVLRGRIAQRNTAREDASEATSAVLEHQLATQERLDATELAETVISDETAAAGELAAQVVLRLASALAGQGADEAG